MLKRLALRDFVIVASLEVEFGGGFSVLTGETGAGKSILIDALQLALGARGDAGVVREGAARSEISAEFDNPPALAAWLADKGFESGDDSLLLRRVIDAQGKSRAWINGSVATVAQLREAADALVDIHGQHAWQSLTRPAAVRALLDTLAGVDAAELARAWGAWRDAVASLAAARARQTQAETERERLAWQIGELDRLAPGEHEWDELNAEHQRVAHAQSLIDGARGALDALAEADTSAAGLTARAIDSLEAVAPYDATLAPLVDELRSAQAQLDDAARSLSGYLNHTEADPQKLAELDARLSAWMGLARRWRRAPAELPALLVQWRDELRALDAATDLDALQLAVDATRRACDERAAAAGAARRRAAPVLAGGVTQAMQQLGMAGGRLEIAFVEHDEPQSFGRETPEFQVAGHAGSTPRPLARVASGGELSRIALAIAVTTTRRDGVATIIFDEIDAGVGGAVAESVGRLMKQLGRSAQVLAVTHLPQVAACADGHFVVSKSAAPARAGANAATVSDVRPVVGEDRVAEIARMLGGERLSGTSLAHAQEMLDSGARPPPPAPRKRASRI